MYLKLIVTLLFLQQCQGLKVLMYQTAFSNTHMPFSGAIADTLISKGHIVDKIIVAYHSNVKSNGSTQLRNVYRLELEENAFMNSEHLVDPFKMRYFDRHAPGAIDTRLKFCKQLMEDETLIKKLKHEKYDSFLIAPFDFCSLALNQILRIPSVNAYSVLGQDGFISYKLGQPMPPSYVPQIFDGVVYGKNKGFLDRLHSLLYLTDYEFDEYGLGTEEYKYLKTIIPNLPSVTELFKTVGYVFVNTNELIDIPQPITGRNVYIGGIAMNPNNGKLSTEIEKILSIPNKGAIMFSFGSLIKTTSIPLQKKIELLRAFRQFPQYSFLWKLAEDDEVRPFMTNFSNVHAIDWLPQIPLLNDKRVKLFISHMGMNSYLEGSYSGKPFVGIPFFVDQFYNMDCALHNEVGVYLDKQNISTESMIDALNQVLGNPKYAQNAKELAQMLKDRPYNVHDELVKNIEFSAKHPGLHKFLQLESADLPLWKLYSIDVILFLLASSLVLITFSLSVLKFLIRLFFTQKFKSKRD